MLAQRVSVPTHVSQSVASDVDTGAVPSSQMMTLTVRLRPDAARTAALEELLAEQMAPGSVAYRQWLSPAEFASRFGATDAQIANIAEWLEANGLSVVGVSPSKLRLTVTGSSAHVASAFAVRLRRYIVPSPDGADTAQSYFANDRVASVPQEIGTLIANVSGLEDKPLLDKITVATTQGSLGTENVDPLNLIEAAVDANVASILTINTAACSADFAAADYAPYKSALQQAEAQGITMLATSACTARGTGSFPASLAEATSVVAPGATLSNAFAGITDRPAWQFADGLPQDGWREEPDVATPEITALAQTLSAIAQAAGTRLGNVAPVLYSLAKAPGLYAQPDDAPAGTWERVDGLGVVDLKKLAELFPRGTIGTSSLLAVSNYAPTHGSNLTLTATVTSTGGSGVPTGTVTFTSTQKGTIGTATLNSSGVATFSTNALPAGTYTTTSVYGGDATYAGSTSGVATITVAGEPSLITATVEPGAAVGGNAAIDVSVTSASGVGTPSGTVTVAPQGTTDSATASATLAGTNGTATATVLLPVFQAGQFTLLVSCMDSDPSFTCYSPISIQAVVGKGATTTSLAAAPNAPAAGVAYTLTATVSGATPAAASAGKGASFARVGGKARSGFTHSGALHPAATAAAAPTGNVQFMDGATYLATGALTAGVATYTGTATANTHSFNAMYSGDANYLTSSSTGTAATGTTPTSTTLASSASAISAGQSITFTSAVSSSASTAAITGTVTYTAAAQGVLGTATISGGMATLTLSTLTAGTYTVTATYSGDATFAPSTSAAKAITVAAQATSIAVTSNVTSALAGLAVTITATVTGTAQSVAGAPSGVVNFYDTYNGVLSEVGSSKLSSAGANTSQAIFTNTGLGAGAHSIYAVYAGDASYSGSTSAAIPLGITDFSAAFSPAAISLTAGQKGQATLTVSYLGGFAGTVSLACTPPPNVELTCSFSPSTLNAASTATLTIGTVAPSNVSGSHVSDATMGRLAGGAILAVLLLVVRPRRLRVYPQLYLLVFALAAAAMVGCSSGTTAAPATPTDPGSSLGTQLLSITAAGSDGTNTVRHDLQYQVTVQ